MKMQLPANRGRDIANVGAAAINSVLVAQGGGGIESSAMSTGHSDRSAAHEADHRPVVPRLARPAPAGFGEPNNIDRSLDDVCGDTAREDSGVRAKALYVW